MPCTTCTCPWPGQARTTHLFAAKLVHDNHVGVVVLHGPQHHRRQLAPLRDHHAARQAYARVRHPVVAWQGGQRAQDASGTAGGVGGGGGKGQLLAWAEAQAWACLGGQKGARSRGVSTAARTHAAGYTNPCLHLHAPRPVPLFAANAPHPFATTDNPASPLQLLPSSAQREATSAALHANAMAFAIPCNCMQCQSQYGTLGTL